jgi:acyl carrier protein
MADPEIYQRLVRCVSEYLEKDVALDPHARLVNAIPGIDSLRLQELLLYIEEKFGVTFNESVLDKTETIQDLANYIGTLTTQAKA